MMTNRRVIKGKERGEKSQSTLTRTNVITEWAKGESLSSLERRENKMWRDYWVRRECGTRNYCLV